MASLNTKRLIQNLLLLLVVAALALFIASREEQPTDLHQTLYDKSIGDDAKEVIIHSQGREDVVLKNENDVWKVVKPSEFLADKDRVRHLFTLLAENADTSYDIKGKDLANYGLDKDRLSVSFNGVKIIFGKLNEVTGNRYMLKGDKMYLVAETVSGLMEMGEEGFRPQSRPKLKPQDKIQAQPQEKPQ